MFMILKLAFSEPAINISPLHTLLVCPLAAACDAHDDESNESLWTLVNRVCDRYIADVSPGAGWNESAITYE
jgi:hypothetical protein